MTKIKNTKKGMAKKTLSMSLVVAMLATSNVPVWASEFSDGSDATAFSAEAETPEVEAPAVDDSEGDIVDSATATPTAIVTDSWTVDGTTTITTGWDAEKVTYDITLNRAIETDKNVKVIFKVGTDEVGTVYAGKAAEKKVAVPFTLKKAYAEKSITTEVYYGSEGNYNQLTSKSTLSVTEAADPATVKSITWSQNGKEYTELPYDAGDVTCEVKLDHVIAEGRKVKIAFTDVTDPSNPQLIKSLDTGTSDTKSAGAKFTLNDATYAGKKIKAVVYYQDANGGYPSTALTDGANNDLTVTEADPTVTGTVTLENTNLTNKNVICPGATLKANIDQVEVATGHSKSDLNYTWQIKNDDKWEQIANTATYTVKTEDHGKEIRVGVYFGSNPDNGKTLFTKGTYTVANRKLSAAGDGAIATGTEIHINGTSGTNKVINTGDSKANELTANDIAVHYTSLAKTDVLLTMGTDYTLTYDPEELNSIGKVKVTVHIIPTKETDFTEDTYTGLEYNLTAGNIIDTEATKYKVTFKDTYTYNGKKQTPEVSDVKYNGKSLAATDYKVQQIGVNAGSYNLVLYLNGKGYLYVDKDGKGVAKDDIAKIAAPLKIEAKNLNDANVAKDLKITVPDEMWTAAKTDVEKNAVMGKDGVKNITVYDTAIDSLEDIYKDNFTIEAMNWTTTDAKKAIRLKGKGNYTGSITIEGKENTRSITQFRDEFGTFFLNAGKNLTYNGKLQDVLGDKLKEGNGTINLQGTDLTVGTNFTYEIISGGTNAGNVSVRIKGAGIYSGEMELPNVYTIAKADFNKDVTDNIKTGLTVSYNPSLGDKGVDIGAYASLAKPSYNAKITASKYALTEGTDYWLDYKGTTTNGGSAGFGSITYTPTVKANTGLGRKEGNKNFNAADRADVTVSLVAKSLHDSDIKVRVVSADYNNGIAVMPKVEVVYVENGKEYPISSDYYYVSIKKAASAVGSTGQVDIIAKTRGTSDGDTTVNKAKHPQLYTGNQVIDYVVGDATLEGGKIVATNDQTTLPSVAYDASAAATTEGITMPAKNYVVKDKGGNVVNPKYYDITYANNKAAGTATITATGKGQYKGTVSAQFTITANKLPSGTVTLMGDNVGKVYTGEAVELTAGKDYVVSGELGKLKLGTDYMVSYDNNVNVTEGANKAKIKFVGINNYAGELVKEFDITSAQIKAENITLGDTTYASGMAIKPSVTITVPGGKATLKEGTDYTVSYEKAATNVGETGKIVITYNKDNKNINAKDSAQTVEYGVTAKDLKDVTVAAIANQEATGEQIKPAVTVMNGSVKLTEGKDYEVVYGDNKAIGEGTVTVKALDSNKNYTGSQTVKFNIVESAAEIGTPVISSVKVVGNKATVILSGDAEGASGYDYVISTDKNCTTSKDYDAISKNQVQTSTAFKYVQKGTYYAYCHAWTRDKNGKKVFGEWSEGKAFKVKATTPAAPVITEVKVKGSTITVTYNKVSNVAGYDVVLGTSSKNDNGELRPYRYGDHKILNINKNK
ncbi:MAG: hypothetical protein MR652_00635, partial [Blautia sp.]|nr:hypothetical protein [Blautia sp.]